MEEVTQTNADDDVSISSFEDLEEILEDLNLEFDVGSSKSNTADESTDKEECGDIDVCSDDCNSQNECGDIDVCSDDCNSENELDNYCDSDLDVDDNTVDNIVKKLETPKLFSKVRFKNNWKHDEEEENDVHTFNNSAKVVDNEHSEVDDYLEFRRRVSTSSSVSNVDEPSLSVNDKSSKKTVVKSKDNVKKTDILEETNSTNRIKNKNTANSKLTKQRAIVEETDSLSEIKTSTPSLKSAVGAETDNQKLLIKSDLSSNLVTLKNNNKRTTISSVKNVKLTVNKGDTCIDENKKNTNKSASNKDKNGRPKNDVKSDKSNADNTNESASKKMVKSDKSITENTTKSASKKDKSNISNKDTKCDNSNTDKASKNTSKKDKSDTSKNDMKCVKSNIGKLTENVSKKDKSDNFKNDDEDSIVTALDDCKNRVSKVNDKTNEKNAYTSDKIKLKKSVKRKETLTNDVEKHEVKTRHRTPSKQTSLEQNSEYKVDTEHSLNDKNTVIEKFSNVDTIVKMAIQKEDNIKDANKKTTTHNDSNINELKLDNVQATTTEQIISETSKYAPELQNNYSPNKIPYDVYKIIKSKSSFSQENITNKPKMSVNTDGINGTTCNVSKPVSVPMAKINKRDPRLRSRSLSISEENANTSPICVTKDTNSQFSDVKPNDIETKEHKGTKLVVNTETASRDPRLKKLASRSELSVSSGNKTEVTSIKDKRSCSNDKKFDVQSIDRNIAEALNNTDLKVCDLSLKKSLSDPEGPNFSIKNESTLKTGSKNIVNLCMGNVSDNGESLQDKISEVVVKSSQVKKSEVVVESLQNKKSEIVVESLQNKKSKIVVNSLQDKKSEIVENLQDKKSVFESEVSCKLVTDDVKLVSNVTMNKPVAPTIKIYQLPDVLNECSLKDTVKRCKSSLENSLNITNVKPMNCFNDIIKSCLNEEVNSANGNVSKTQEIEDLEVAKSLKGDEMDKKTTCDTVSEMSPISCTDDDPNWVTISKKYGVSQVTKTESSECDINIDAYRRVIVYEEGECSDDSEDEHKFAKYTTTNVKLEEELLWTRRKRPVEEMNTYKSNESDRFNSSKKRLSSASTLSTNSLLSSEVLANNMISPQSPDIEEPNNTFNLNQINLTSCASTLSNKYLQSGEASANDDFFSPKSPDKEEDKGIFINTSKSAFSMKKPEHDSVTATNSVSDITIAFQNEIKEIAKSLAENKLPITEVEAHNASTDYTKIIKDEVIRLMKSVEFGRSLSSNSSSTVSTLPTGVASTNSNSTDVPLESTSFLKSNDSLSEKEKHSIISNKITSQAHDQNLQEIKKRKDADRCISKSIKKLKERGKYFDKKIANMLKNKSLHRNLQTCSEMKSYLNKKLQKVKQVQREVAKEMKKSTGFIERKEKRLIKVISEKSNKIKIIKNKRKTSKLIVKEHQHATDYEYLHKFKNVKNFPFNFMELRSYEERLQAHDERIKRTMEVRGAKRDNLFYVNASNELCIGDFLKRPVQRNYPELIDKNVKPYLKPNKYEDKRTPNQNCFNNDVQSIKRKLKSIVVKPTVITPAVECFQEFPVNVNTSNTSKMKVKRNENVSETVTTKDNSSNMDIDEDSNELFPTITSIIKSEHHENRNGLLNQLQISPSETTVVKDVLVSPPPPKISFTIKRIEDLQNQKTINKDLDKSVLTAFEGAKEESDIGNSELFTKSIKPPIQQFNNLVNNQDRKLLEDSKLLIIEDANSIENIGGELMVDSNSPITKKANKIVNIKDHNESTSSKLPNPDNVNKETIYVKKRKLSTDSKTSIISLASSQSCVIESDSDMENVNTKKNENKEKKVKEIKRKTSLSYYANDRLRKNKNLRRSSGNWNYKDLDNAHRYPPARESSGSDSSDEQPRRIRTSVNVRSRSPLSKRRRKFNRRTRSRSSSSNRSRSPNSNRNHRRSSSRSSSSSRSRRRSASRRRRFNRSRSSTRSRSRSRDRGQIPILHKMTRDILKEENEKALKLLKDSIETDAKKAKAAVTELLDDFSVKLASAQNSPLDRIQHGQVPVDTCTADMTVTSTSEMRLFTVPPPPMQFTVPPPSLYPNTWQPPPAANMCLSIVPLPDQQFLIPPPLLPNTSSTFSHPFQETAMLHSQELQQPISTLTISGSDAVSPITESQIIPETTSIPTCEDSYSNPPMISTNTEIAELNTVENKLPNNAQSYLNLPQPTNTGLNINQETSTTYTPSGASTDDTSNDGSLAANNYSSLATDHCSAYNTQSYLNFPPSSNAGLDTSTSVTPMTSTDDTKNDGNLAANNYSSLATDHCSAYNTQSYLNFPPSSYAGLDTSTSVTPMPSTDDTKNNGSLAVSCQRSVQQSSILGETPPGLLPLGHPVHYKEVQLPKFPYPISIPVLNSNRRGPLHEPHNPFSTGMYAKYNRLLRKKMENRNKLNWQVSLLGSTEKTQEKKKSQKVVYEEEQSDTKCYDIPSVPNEHNSVSTENYASEMLHNMSTTVSKTLPNNGCTKASHPRKKERRKRYLDEIKSDERNKKLKIVVENGEKLSDLKEVSFKDLSTKDKFKFLIVKHNPKLLHFHDKLFLSEQVLVKLINCFYSKNKVKCSDDLQLENSYLNQLKKFNAKCISLKYLPPKDRFKYIILRQNPKLLKFHNKFLLSETVEVKLINDVYCDGNKRNVYHYDYSHLGKSLLNLRSCNKVSVKEFCESRAISSSINSNNNKLVVDNTILTSTEKSKICSEVKSDVCIQATDFKQADSVVLLSQEHNKDNITKGREKDLTSFGLDVQSTVSETLSIIPSKPTVGIIDTVDFKKPDYTNQSTALDSELQTTSSETVMVSTNEKSCVEKKSVDDSKEATTQIIENLQETSCVNSSVILPIDHTVKVQSELQRTPDHLILSSSKSTNSCISKQRKFDDNIDVKSIVELQRTLSDNFDVISSKSTNSSISKQRKVDDIKDVTSIVELQRTLSDNFDVISSKSTNKNSCISKQRKVADTKNVTSIVKLQQTLSENLDTIPSKSAIEISCISKKRKIDVDKEETSIGELDLKQKTSSATSTLIPQDFTSKIDEQKTDALQEINSCSQNCKENVNTSKRKKIRKNETLEKRVLPKRNCKDNSNIDSPDTTENKIVVDKPQVDPGSSSQLFKVVGEEKGMTIKVSISKTRIDLTGIKWQDEILVYDESRSLGKPSDTFSNERINVPENSLASNVGVLQSDLSKESSKVSDISKTSNRFDNNCVMTINTDDNACDISISKSNSVINDNFSSLKDTLKEITAGVTNNDVQSYEDKMSSTNSKFSGDTDVIQTYVKEKIEESTSKEDIESPKPRRSARGKTQEACLRNIIGMETGHQSNSESNYIISSPFVLVEKIDDKDKIIVNPFADQDTSDSDNSRSFDQLISNICGSLEENDNEICDTSVDGSKDLFKKRDNVDETFLETINILNSFQPVLKETYKPRKSVVISWRKSSEGPFITSNLNNSAIKSVGRRGRGIAEKSDTSNISSECINNNDYSLQHDISSKDTLKPDLEVHSLGTPPKIENVDSMKKTNFVESEHIKTTDNVKENITSSERVSQVNNENEMVESNLKELDKLNHEEKNSNHSNANDDSVSTRNELIIDETTSSILVDNSMSSLRRISNDSDLEDVPLSFIKEKLCNKSILESSNISNHNSVVRGDFNVNTFENTSFDRFDDPKKNEVVNCSQNENSNVKCAKKVSEDSIIKSAMNVDNITGMDFANKSLTYEEFSKTIINVNDVQSCRNVGTKSINKSDVSEKLVNEKDQGLDKGNSDISLDCSGNTSDCISSRLRGRSKRLLDKSENSQSLIVTAQSSNKSADEKIPNSVLPRRKDESELLLEMWNRISSVVNLSRRTVGTNVTQVDNELIGFDKSEPIEKLCKTQKDSDIDVDDLINMLHRIKDIQSIKKEKKS